MDPTNGFGPNVLQRYPYMPLTRSKRDFIKICRDGPSIYISMKPIQNHLKVDFAYYSEGLLGSNGVETHFKRCLIQ